MLKGEVEEVEEAEKTQKSRSAAVVAVLVRVSWTAVRRVTRRSWLKVPLAEWMLALFPEAPVGVIEMRCLSV